MPSGCSAALKARGRIKARRNVRVNPLRVCEASFLIWRQTFTSLFLAIPLSSLTLTQKESGSPWAVPAAVRRPLPSFLFEQHGVQKKDFKPYYFTYKETVEGLQDGSLDGGFLAGGYPISSYSELSTRQSVRIVPVDEKILKKITHRARILLCNRC